MLKQGKVPIYEPGLEEMVRRNAEEQRLSFTTDVTRAVRSSDIIFIAVGTPQGPDGQANLDHAHPTVTVTAKAMNSFTVIGAKWTVPAGTAEQIKPWRSKQ